MQRRVAASCLCRIQDRSFTPSGPSDPPNQSSRIPLRPPPFHFIYPSASARRTDNRLQHLEPRHRWNIPRRSPASRERRGRQERRDGKNAEVGARVLPGDRQSFLMGEPLPARAVASASRIRERRCGRGRSYDDSPGFWSLKITPPPSLMELRRDAGAFCWQERKGTSLQRHGSLKGLRCFRLTTPVQSPACRATKSTRQNTYLSDPLY